MSYVKKVLIFSEVEKGFAVRGKTVSGVLKLEKTDGKAVASLFVSNFNVSILGQVICVLKVGGEIYKQNVLQFNEFKFNLNSLENEQSVNCVLAIWQGRVWTPFASASSGKDKRQALELLRLIDNREKKEETFNESGGEQANDTDEEPVTEYEKFVEETDNYYQAVNSEIENMFKKSGNYLNNVKEKLEEVFEKYPPFEELTKAVKNSCWVKIPCKGDGYFAFGAVNEEGVPVRFCYAVPAKGNKKPKDKGFVQVNTGNRIFWMLSQDAQTGKLIKTNI